MLQVTVDKVTPVLTNIFSSCINFGYVPLSWRKVKIVFIPKAGTANHCLAKDYRPISLSSFLLKVMETIIDSHISSFFNNNAIASTQHAYVKGKSVDTGLHETVKII